MRDRIEQIIAEFNLQVNALGRDVAVRELATALDRAEQTIAELKPAPVPAPAGGTPLDTEVDRLRLILASRSDTSSRDALALIDKLIAHPPGAVPEPMRDEMEARRTLWMSHGCPLMVLYGDDGEMQCNNTRHVSLDFKRDPLDRLVRATVNAIQTSAERAQGAAAPRWEPKLADQINRMEKAKVLWPQDWSRLRELALPRPPARR